MMTLLWNLSVFPNFKKRTWSKVESGLGKGNSWTWQERTNLERNKNSIFLLSFNFSKALLPNYPEHIIYSALFGAGVEAAHLSSLFTRVGFSFLLLLLSFFINGFSFLIHAYINFLNLVNHAYINIAAWYFRRKALPKTS